MSDRNVHIYIATGQGYLPRVRKRGQRKYEVLGTPRATEAEAMAELTKAFANPDYKRGDILLTADWYDPTQLLEIVRK